MVSRQANGATGDDSGAAGSSDCLKRVSEGGPPDGTPTDNLSSEPSRCQASQKAANEFVKALYQLSTSEAKRRSETTGQTPGGNFGSQRPRQLNFNDSPFK